MLPNEREELLEYYLAKFCLVSDVNQEKFRRYYAGFTIIRLMQALGAFGYRGLYEKKPTFTESIVPGVKLLQEVVDSVENQILLPELYGSIRSINSSGLFLSLLEGK